MTGHVNIPMQWVKALRRTGSGSAYQLMVEIAAQVFKQPKDSGETVLSSQLIGMPRSTKARAVAELARLRLVKVEKLGRGRAVRIVPIL